MGRKKPRKGMWRILILGALAALGTLSWLLWLPDVKILKKNKPKTTAYIELRKGQARQKGKILAVRWTWVSSDAISEHLKKAVVTAEDDMFYQHDGVDWDALQNAWSRDWREHRLIAGGSTITMQLARNLYLSPSKNPLRKIKEILIARKLERELGKHRILEIYLNVVEWGPGLFGCEAAAQSYFSKSCSDLTQEEAVAMAVVLPNPRRWNPAQPGRYVERNSRRISERMISAESLIAE